jgi:hypothetical protein
MDGTLNIRVELFDFLVVLPQLRGNYYTAVDIPPVLNAANVVVENRPEVLSGGCVTSSLVDLVEASDDYLRRLHILVIVEQILLSRSFSRVQPCLAFLVRNQSQDLD